MLYFPALLKFYVYFLLQEELLLEHFSDLIKFVKTRACKFVKDKNSFFNIL